MGSCLSRCVYDPPVHRCCDGKGCCGPCLRCTDKLLGVRSNETPQALKSLENVAADGRLVEVETRLGHRIHIFCFERPGARMAEDDRSSLASLHTWPCAALHGASANVTSWCGRGSTFDVIYSHGRLEAIRQSISNPHKSISRDDIAGP